MLLERFSAQKTALTPVKLGSTMRRGFVKFNSSFIINIKLPTRKVYNP